MNIKIRVILSFIFLNGLFFPSTVYSKPVGTPLSSTPPESIIFQNFAKKLTLIRNGQLYQLAGSDEKFKLSNRLIVKTTKNISQRTLSHIHPLITGATQLFSGRLNDYYSLELKDDSALPNALDILQNKKGIVLVQPDILQLTPEITLSGNKLNKTNNSLAKVKARAERKEKRQEKKITRAKEPSPHITLLDIQSLWPKTKGKGVKVAIIDDGFNLEQPNLQHLTPAFSYDSESRKLASSPHSAIDTHGTKVAGIIFAAHNKGGINGIAPEAEIIALRQPDTWTSNTLLSFQLAKLAGASVINCSWHTYILLQPVAEIVDEMAQYGREGKGIAVVFAAGNQGKELKPYSTEASINSAIVVGAYDKNFKPLSSTNYGKSVDLMAYGGTAQTTLASGKQGIFSGTSLAAAIVSGMAALLLSQHPDMMLDQLTHKLKLHTGKNPRKESNHKLKIE